ncbi:MAG: hypothetical protein AB9846_11035 [Tenuifilaceae bacterium]
MSSLGVSNLPLTAPLIDIDLGAGLLICGVTVESVIIGSITCLGFKGDTSGS